MLWNYQRPVPLLASSFDSSTAITVCLMVTEPLFAQDSTKGSEKIECEARVRKRLGPEAGISVTGGCRKCS